MTPPKIGSLWASLSGLIIRVKGIRTKACSNGLLEISVMFTLHADTMFKDYQQELPLEEFFQDYKRVVKVGEHYEIRHN